MNAPKGNENYSHDPKEVLRRMLNTPPKKHERKKDQKKKPAK